MPIKRIEDTFGRPVSFKRAWRFSGHRSRSDAEKDELAREALEAEGRGYVNNLKREGVNCDFDHVQLTANVDQGSETEQIWDGTRKHVCWGTAVGYLWVSVP